MGIRNNSHIKVIRRIQNSSPLNTSVQDVEPKQLLLTKLNKTFNAALRRNDPEELSYWRIIQITDTEVSFLLKSLSTVWKKGLKKHHIKAEEWQTFNQKLDGTNKYPSSLVELTFNESGEVIISFWNEDKDLPIQFFNVVIRSNDNLAPMGVSLNSFSSCSWQQARLMLLDYLSQQI